MIPYSQSGVSFLVNVMIPKKCEIEKCNRDAEKWRKTYKGSLIKICTRHRGQLCTYGRILARTSFDMNDYRISNKIVVMNVYNHRNKKKSEFIFDIEDLYKIKKYKWCIDDGKYPMTTLDDKTTKIRLHTFLLGKKEGFVIDHINQNTLDNRRKNLRFCTKQQNHWNNKSLGISWDKSVNLWKAHINYNGKQIYLGSSIKREKALVIRKNGEKKYFGDFARKE